MNLRRNIAIIWSLSQGLFLSPASVACAQKTVSLHTQQHDHRQPRGLYQRFAAVVAIVPATYAFFFTNYHLATESATAGFMAGVGDVLAQTISAKPKADNGESTTTSAKPTSSSSHNSVRTFHFVLKGMGEGIAWSYWYRLAERWSTRLTRFVLRGHLNPSDDSNSSVVRVVKTAISIFIDLTIMCPIIYGLWDIPFPALMKGTPVPVVFRRIQNKLGGMLIASFEIWTPANVVIYNCPLQYRVIVMSMADVIWQTVVSTIVSQEHDGSVDEEAHTTPSDSFILLAAEIRKVDETQLPSSSEEEDEEEEASP